MTELNDHQSSQALAEVKAVHESGVATINSRDYEIGKINHIRRRTVFAFLSKIQGSVAKQDFWWLESDDFEKVEKIINKTIIFDGMTLDKIPDHWDRYPEDYMQFIIAIMGALAYPFMKGVNGG